MYVSTNVCISVYVSVYPSLCAYMCPSMCLCMCLSLCLSMCVSMCVSMCQYKTRAECRTPKILKQSLQRLCRRRFFSDIHWYGRKMSVHQSSFVHERSYRLISTENQSVQLVSTTLSFVKSHWKTFFRKVKSFTKKSLLDLKI